MDMRLRLASDGKIAESCELVDFFPFVMILSELLLSNTVCKSDVKTCVDIF